MPPDAAAVMDGYVTTHNAHAIRMMCLNGWDDMADLLSLFTPGFRERQAPRRRRPCGAAVSAGEGPLGRLTASQSALLGRVAQTFPSCGAPHRLLARRERAVTPNIRRVGRRSRV